LPAIQRGYVTFGCLNNFCKVNDDVLNLWSKVLSALPGSRLLILAGEGSHRQRVLQRLGVDSSRIEFVARRPRQEYLKLYHRIDLALDTFPYNGHTTSLDAMWMGVPTITLIGDSPVGRAGLCQLANIGMTGLVAKSAEDYMRIALELASNSSRLAELRASLRHRMQQSPLMDAPQFARNMEKIYREIWRLWCANLSADE
jgi:predicted O-linked N-acetylglucosamine transferase (SPINDLY family)